MWQANCCEKHLPCLLETAGKAAHRSNDPDTSGEADVHLFIEESATENIISSQTEQPSSLELEEGHSKSMQRDNTPVTAL